VATPEGAEAPFVPQPRRQKDWDAYAAVIASFIGLLALAVSGYTAYLQRQQTKAIVWPSVTLGRSTYSHKFIVSNDGMGPARITAVRVEVKGTVVHDWSEAHRAAGNLGKNLNFHSSTSGRVIPPNGKIEMYEATKSDEAHRAYDVLFDEVPFGVTVCYCSVLDDCWLTTFGKRAFPSGEIDRCPIPPADRFQQ
jgi:hypothetical protein